MKSIAIFQRSDEFLGELKNYFEKATEFKVCASTTNGNDAIEALKSVKPDIAIIDPSLKGIDGISLLDLIKKVNPECYSFMVSEFDNDKIVNASIKHGAIYYFIKPITPQAIAERIFDIIADKAIEQKFMTDLKERPKSPTLDEQISNIFITIGIPPHIKGYVYLRESIKMAIERPAIINKVTKELYPKVALKHSTTASKVERAIRHAIEVAWNRGRTDAISAVFGARVYIGNERPTNSEFIALVADKLILENFL